MSLAPASSLGTRVAPARSPRRRVLIRNLEGWIFIAPSVLGLVIFTAGPMLASAYFSLCDYDLVRPPVWAGFNNYVRLFTRDRLFYVSLSNTAYYTFLAVPLQTLMALAQAMLLNMRLKGVNIYRTLFYFPTITPTVATVILWTYILSKNYGLANSLLWVFGIPAINWLFEPSLAKFSLILMSLWQVGGRMVIFLAALQGVPEELYEASALDGASWWRKQINVTLPMISPVVFFNVIMGVIGTFQVFAAAFIATGGGPVNATLFYVLLLYRQAFENLRMGVASAMAWVLFLIVMAVTGLQFVASKRWVYYEAA